MQRITITIDDDLLQAVDNLMTRRGYTSRSEAFRDIVRSMADQQSAGDPKAACIATLSYVYDHDLSVASLHVHLDHEACLEVAVLRGPSGSVTTFADALATQRGVRHAHLQLIPVQVSTAHHKHGGHAVKHTHVHA
jgi:CopG family nickel-responsive transcriptional regulator